ncbi:hypothetical protein C1H46_021275 [Malus baccata]|uniref:Uncharacterized protein n=1 Tax=Malus baccata TaxID=106549 RepID=A0A540M2Z4_MALBA|nr:hypothetical protein C1H46_021275 [Malus baccata]
MCEGLKREDAISINHNWFNANNIRWVEDAISINHNWFNANNIRWVGDYYYKAMEYIQDIKDICDDFEGLCQQNLAANTGKVQTFEESLNSVDDSVLYPNILADEPAIT